MNFLNLKSNKFFFLGLLIAFVVAFLDLLSKDLVFSMVENNAKDGSYHHEMRIFSFFSLVKVWNKGVSFGMFNNLENSKIVFSFIQGGMAFLISIWLFFNQTKNMAIALGLIIGGALGNFIDRMQHGAVADFLDFYVGNYHWPAFNLADSAVFLGVTIIILEDFFFKKTDKK